MLKYGMPRKPTPAQDLSHLSDADLEKVGWHEIPVKRLARLCDPLSCWIEVDDPIKPQEVLDCIARGEEALVDTPLWTAIVFKKTRVSAEENRLRHIQKVAWFVKNPAKDPISIEVGCARLGVRIDHIIEDGNHRLAAAIIRGDKSIAARVGGGIDDAKEMKLWNPNVFEVELCRRQEAAWEAQQKQQRRKKVSP